MKKTRGIVCGGHQETVNAGAEILREGGNAFDAALACFLASFVAEPLMSSPAGGGYMTGFAKNGETAVFDFFCQTPITKRLLEDIEFFPIEIDFGTTSEEFIIGMGTTGVPGSTAGIFEIHERLCSLPLALLAEPAMEMAKRGVAVDSFQRLDFDLLTPIIHRNADYRPIFFPDDQLIALGETLALPALADFLEVLVKEGRDFFYRGEISTEILKLSTQHGGHLSREDFESYQVKIRDPLKFNYKGHTILTNPHPSRGGSIMALLMGLKSNQKRIHPPFSPQNLIQLVEVLIKSEKIRQSNLDIMDFIGDFNSDPLTVFNYERYRAKKWGSTTHFNVVDEHGNAASLSTTNGEGNSYTVPGTTIPLNNMLGEEALFPEGMNGWNTNQRISSMMAPTLVLDSTNKVELALGTGGAGRIPSSMMLTLHYLLDQGIALEEAVHSPRIFWKEGTLNIERGFDPDTRFPPEVENTIWWDEPNMFFGGVHSIQVLKKHFEGAGDPRRNGAYAKID